MCCPGGTEHMLVDTTWGFALVQYAPVLVCKVFTTVHFTSTISSILTILLLCSQMAPTS